VPTCPSRISIHFFYRLPVPWSLILPELLRAFQDNFLHSLNHILGASGPDPLSKLALGRKNRIFSAPTLRLIQIDIKLPAVVPPQQDKPPSPIDRPLEPHGRLIVEVQKLDSRTDHGHIVNCPARTCLSSCFQSV